MNCPNPDTCVLCVQDGKVCCQTHHQTLTINDDPPATAQALAPVPMRHVLYVAYLSPKGAGHILIDAEQ
jgi:hypothetical protein